MSYVQSEGQWRPECAICKESVTLEESKVDEHGQAMHEACYVSKIVRTADPKVSRNKLQC